MDALEIDPCIPKGWDGFTLTRQWRGAQYDITVENPEHVSKGVCQIFPGWSPDGKKYRYRKPEAHTRCGS